MSEFDESRARGDRGAVRPRPRRARAHPPRVGRARGRRRAARAPLLRRVRSRRGRLPRLRRGAEGDELVPGLESGTLPGGRYLRARLRGDPPAVYERIGPTFDELMRKRSRTRAGPASSTTAATTRSTYCCRSSAARSSARRRLRIVRVPDRADDRDAGRARGHDLGDVREVDAADREPRDRQRCRRGAEELETAGDRVLLRRRGERGDADVVGAGDVGELVAASRPRARAADRARRAPAPPATGVSLRPTWTPSAPHASTRSGRSLRTKSAPCSSHAARNGAAAATSASSSSSLSRSWTTSTPPRSAASSSGRGSSPCGRASRTR